MFTAADAPGAIADAMSTLHHASGLPWCATLAVSALCARLVTAPVAARTTKASATVSAASALAKATKQGDAERVSIKDVLEAMKELRERSGVGAHPAWLVAGPLAQIPLFACAMMAVRRLASEGDSNGLISGGFFWFSDLTLPAMDIATMSAPMGPYGAVLPIVTAGALFANVNANFAAAAQQSRGMTIVKLCLEWMTLPMLLIGLQLPQAVHCYWITSSAYAYAQNRALSTAYAREALGVNELAKTTREIVREKGLHSDERLEIPPVVLELIKAAAKARAENNNPLAINLLLRASRGGSDDANAHGRSTEPMRGDELGKAHPTVLFALGQTYAVLKDWKKSAITYEYSARNEPDALRRARALLGAGVARARLGDLGMASEALGEANRLNPSDASVKIALASALKLNGDPEGALQILREAATIQPDIDERYVKPLERELASRTTA